MTHPTYPTPPRRRTSPLAIVAVVAGVLVTLVVVAAVAVMAVGGSGETAPGSRAVAGESTHPAGSTATDSRFTFRVTSVDTARRVKGDSGKTWVAQGKFVEVWLAVTNKAARARFISADDQQLHAGGKSLGVDIDATVEVDEGPEIGLPEKISGGNTETILLVFDVPVGAKPTALEVHGDTDTAGALIALPGS